MNQIKLHRNFIEIEISQINVLETGDEGGEESDECHTAENFFRSFLKNPFAGEATSGSEQEEAPDELGNSGQTRPQNLELGNQSASEIKISPGDEVWLKFMGEILQPTQDPSNEESVVSESIARPFEEERNVLSPTIGPEVTQPAKFSGSLSRIKPSPLERISHGDHQIQTSSRCSPKSPPSSPSWARYRESPTRSPVSRTRSPQMSPCEKHSAKMIEGMAAVSDFRDPTLAMTSLEFSGLPPAEPSVGGIDAGSLEDPELGSCIDLASFAATVVSSTAYLMGMSISPPEYIPESREDAAAAVPTTSAEEDEPENNVESSVSEERQLELALEQIQQSLQSHLLSTAQDEWSPLRDLYPIVDIASSLQWLDQDKSFNTENEAEFNENVTEVEGIEPLEDISENIAALKTSGILTPLKRCPSFSNIPSLTSALEEQKAVVSSSPVEFKELQVYEEIGNAEQQHIASDFEEIFKSTVVKPDVISIVTLADKDFDDFDCHNNRGNFLEIEDNYDLYSASSSPEVPSDSYNSIKMNSNDHLAVGIDEQNFILSSDDDQEIDLDEDIPPKHLIGTRRSKDLREQSIISGFGEEVDFPSSKDGLIDEEKTQEALEFKCSMKTTEDVSLFFSFFQCIALIL